MKTMKAVRFHSYGGPEVLEMEEIPRPQPDAKEVLIQVRAAGVNPLDWKVRAGHVKDWLKHRLPLIPGWDVSGVVAAIGHGHTDFRVGDEVFALLDFMRDGAYAEYALAEKRNLAPKPKHVDYIKAGATPLASLTAWQALFDVADLVSGQTVLIHGAAGGVGHFAVQFAKWKGAEVIGTASANNERFLLDLGADKVIDYRATNFEEVVHDVDVVFDTIGGDVQRRSWRVLKKGGILVATLGVTSEEEARRLGVRGEGVMVHPDEAQLAHIGHQIDIGELKPAVSEVLPLAEAAKAHELSQTGHVRGKIVLHVSE
jgi:NADPH:quinone reductase-like Zn-dependent oxidoreductase